MNLRNLNIILIATAFSFGAVSHANRTDKGSDPSFTLLRSDYKTGEITSLCKAAMDKATVRLNALAAISVEKRSFENTMLGFENITADLSDETTPLTFMGYVLPNDAIREEASNCEAQVGSYLVGISSRKDIFLAIRDTKARSPQEERLASETLKAFEKNGLKLADDQLAKVTALKQKLADMESKFSTNLNNDKSTLSFTAADLDGVSADYLNSLKKNAEGFYVVTTKETDYVRVMESAKKSETRKKMLLAYTNRAADQNVKLLEDAIQTRQQIAKLMGYKTWADYRIEGRMAKDAVTVMSFLNGLKDKLALRNKQDLAKLLEFKKTVESTSTDVKAWDVTYLSYQVKKRDFQLDDDAIREYFPADVVMKGLFDVYSQMLGVKYLEIQGASVWAADVKVYKIVDSKNNQLIGYFYTDFTPRPGKYGHAAAFPLLSARLMATGYSKPVSAIVANLTPPSNGKPSLMNHGEVETVFHEFGHIMHQTLTKAPYASLSGSNVAQDFVEAPSQMLENWVWSPEVLTMLSGHYTDHSKKLPAELLKKMIEARNFNRGYYYTRQLMLALTDMTYHSTDGAVDSTALYSKMYKDVMGIDPMDGWHFQASFGHLMGGYDAGYYGYLWSEVYAADMFTRFEKEGLLSPKTGADYRSVILENGNMIEATELLKQFLGRPSNSEAFFKKLGLSI